MNETIIDVLLGVLIFLTIANQFAAHKAKKAGDELRRWAEERDSSAKLYEDQCIAQQQLIDNLYERLAKFDHRNRKRDENGRFVNDDDADDPEERAAPPSEGAQ